MGYFNRLIINLRFYVLLFSAILAAAIYYFIGQSRDLPGGGLLSMIQWYALIAVTFLYFTLLASPLSRIFPTFPFRAKYIFARRALGVSAFMFGSLHAYFAMFEYLGGPLAVLQMPFASQLPVALGLTAWTILFLMALTATDYAVVKLSAPRWKFLHRFIYLVAVLITIHALLLGSHFVDLSDFLPQVFSLALSFLLVLEAIRFDRYLKQKFPSLANFRPSLVITVFVLFIYYTINLLPHEIADILTFQSTHSDNPGHYLVYHNEEDFLDNAWVSKHSIHLLGGIVVFGFLIFALIKQAKGKTNPPKRN